MTTNVDLGGDKLTVENIEVGVTQAGKIGSGTSITATELGKLSGLTSSTAELNILTGVTATAGQLNNTAVTATRVNSTTGTTQVLASSDDGRTFVLNRAAGGQTITLPLANAARFGMRFRFVVGTALTGSTYVITTSTGTDKFNGVVIGVNDTAVGTGLGSTLWSSYATASTVTLANAAGAGPCKIGDWIEVECVGTGNSAWAIRGVIFQSGTEVTPFS